MGLSCCCALISSPDLLAHFDDFLWLGSLPKRCGVPFQGLPGAKHVFLLFLGFFNTHDVIECKDVKEDEKKEK